MVALMSALNNLCAAYCLVGYYLAAAEMVGMAELALDACSKGQLRLREAYKFAWAEWESVYIDRPFHQVLSEC